MSNDRTTTKKPDGRDFKIVEAQLGRSPRDVHGVAHRCPCGEVDVVETPPRLSDGTPFPTFFYATCPQLTSAISTLESSGLMKELNIRLAHDTRLQGEYYSAHLDYIAARDALGMEVPEVAGISAGGMPDRVKCLHSLIAHSLASGQGANQIGDEALARLPSWWQEFPCSDLIPRESR